MKSQQKPLPSKNIQKENVLSDKFAPLPLEVRSCGCSDDRRIQFAQNYSLYVAFYLLEGTVKVTRFRESLKINPDELFISCCNTGITFTRSSSRCRYYYVMFSGDYAKLYYNMIRDKNAIVHVTPIHELDSLFNSLCEIEYREQMYIQMHASFLLHQLLHELVLTTHEINEARLKSPPQQTVVNSAIRYISEHYMEELTVDTICENVSFSKYYFCRLFKEQTGSTLHQYLNKYRINKSRELLTYSKLPIHTIALETGFKNTLTYSRCFKQQMNMTPSEYREQT